MKKRHHFVPQFYLRGFATLEPKEEIWTYDAEQEEVRGSTVENTAFEKYLYSVTLEDGTRVDALEDLIADIEGKAAPLFEKLIKDGTLLGQERADFASFMALMQARTDAARQQYAEMAMAVLQLQQYFTASHDGAFQSNMKGFQEKHGPLDAKSIEGIREAMLHPDKYEVRVSKEWTLQALELHDHVTPIYHAMNWSVMLPEDEQRYFIAGDNPVVDEVPLADQKGIFRGGLAHKKMEVTFPLTASACLLASWQKDMPKWFSIGRDAMMMANRARARYATRFLFGPVRDHGILKLATKYKGPGRRLQMGPGGPEEYSPVRLDRGR